MNILIFKLLILISIGRSSAEDVGRTLFPEHMHVVSSITLPSSSPNQHNFYRADEYVDLGTKRSSISLYDRRTGETRIFYNEFSTTASSLVSQRKFLSYEAKYVTCRLARISDWPLASLRQIAIEFHELSNLDQRLVDVSIGPSTLLYALSYALDKFKFVRETFSESRLTDIDEYRAEVFNIAAPNYDDKFEVILEVKNRGNQDHRSKQVGESLAESARDAKSFQVSSICVRKKGIEDEEPEEQVDCLASEGFLFFIEYELMSEYSLASRSLAGDSLELFTTNDYNFSEEPFVQPIGIGCWVDETESDNSGLDDGSLMSAPWQRTLAQMSRQMSAEYISHLGTRGVSYVAYDGYRNLLRLDRNGRKNVYDLMEKRSYHTDQWSTAHESDHQDSPASFESDEMLEKCVVLKISDSNSLGSPDADVTGRLLGLNRGSKTHYLGKKIIDHAAFNVYELEIFQELPIILEATKIRLPANKASAKGKRYILTFYAQEYPNAALRADFEFERSSAASGLISGQELQQRQLIPRYMELREFDMSTNQRRILNRIEFIEFSWSLDVDPSNDPESQKGLANLFSMRECYLDRSQQADLVVRMSQSKSKSSHPIDNPNQLEGLKKQRESMAEVMHEYLAQLLDLSRLNIASMSVEISDSGDALFEARLSELVSGVSYLEPIGRAHFSTDTLLDEYMLRVFHNRHSMTECQLDSFAWWQSNWFAYCPRLTICVLLEQKEELKKKLSGSNARTKTSEDTKTTTTAPKNDSEGAGLELDRDLCNIFNFRWSRTANAIGTSEWSGGRIGSAIRLAERSLYKLAHLNLKFNFRYRDSQTGRWARRTYDSSFGSHRFTKLSPIGDSGWTDLSRTLAGLSYSTMAEEPRALNMNRRIALGSGVKDVFQVCQLACQMDDQCGSFSVCKRGQLASFEDGCILSTLRLTSERIHFLASKALKSQEKKEEKFEAKIVGELSSQILAMHRNDACSIHSKDFSSSYALKKTLQILVTPKLNEDKEPIFARPAARVEQEGLRRVTSMSFDDCAGLSFELSALSDPAQVNFTHCPLDATCYIGYSAAQLLANVTHSSGICNIWKRELTQFYDMYPMKRMIIYENEKHIPAKDLSLDEHSARVGGANISRVLWDLDTEGCARDCNLHRAQCLAFDSCRHDGRQVCFLYSIRSAKIRKSARLPYLEQEKGLRYITYNDDDAAAAAAKTTSDKDKELLSVAIGPSIVCNHYSLKQGYFEVRLWQMQSHEEISKRHEEELHLKELEQFEAALLDEDEKHSAEQLKKAKLEEEEGHERNDDEEMLKSGNGIESNGNRVQWLALLLGALFGLVGTMFRQQLAQGAEHLYLIYRERRSGVSHANDGLSQLVINENR